MSSMKGRGNDGRGRHGGKSRMNRRRAARKGRRSNATKRMGAVK